MAGVGVAIASGAAVAYVPCWVSWGFFAFLLGGETAARMGIPKDERVGGKGFRSSFGLDRGVGAGGQDG